MIFLIVLDFWWCKSARADLMTFLSPDEENDAPTGPWNTARSSCGGAVSLASSPRSDIRVILASRMRRIWVSCALTR